MWGFPGGSDGRVSKETHPKVSAEDQGIVETLLGEGYWQIPLFHSLPALLAELSELRGSIISQPC